MAEHKGPGCNLEYLRYHDCVLSIEGLPNVILPKIERPQVTEIIVTIPIVRNVEIWYYELFGVGCGYLDSGYLFDEPMDFEKGDCYVMIVGVEDYEI